ncbi:FGGY-family carbohydrate kinase [Alsobacter sp. R-9]
MTEGPRVAVLDIGKTNLKVLVASADGRPVEAVSRAHEAVKDGPYLSIDIEAIEAFFLDALRELATRHPIGAVVATAHGCGALLVDETGPVLPMMDYETPCPAWLDEAYAAQAPTYGEVFCSIGPGAMRLAKQLMWQERDFPDAFRSAKWYLTTAQYMAWRLGGRPASEISQLAAQGHLWAPEAAALSSVVRRHGWDRLFPPMARAGEVLGTVAPGVAARTGLLPGTQILCGVHDSNANLFRYKASGMAGTAVLSTGTWMIGFNRGRPLRTLDERRAMVSNIDVDGEPVASTLTMTGREYAILAGSQPSADDETMAAIGRLLQRGTWAYPSFVEDDGLFPGSSRRGDVAGPPPTDPAERRGLAALYAAFSADFCLDVLGTDAPVVVDGGFALNVPFGRLLATLRPQKSVSMSLSKDGTALGAGLLWNRFDRRGPVTTPELVSVQPFAWPGLREAATRWRREAESRLARTPEA